MGKRWPPNSDVQINSFWEWAVRHMAERPRISGTIIQKVAVIKTYNECPKLKNFKKGREDNNINGERGIQIGFRIQKIEQDSAQR